MIKVRSPVVVEGKYDRIKLGSLIDGVLIETGGFRIYKDKELLQALRALADTVGIIILTDSDRAGFKIRNYIKGALGPDAKVTQVYIPAISGKESRKSEPSAEGLLGVEGLSEAQLTEAFNKAGVTCEPSEARNGITVVDLLEAGLTGKPDSAAKRRELLCRLQLPPRLSTSSMRDMLNLLFTREEFLKLYYLI